MSNNCLMRQQVQAGQSGRFLWHFKSYGFTKIGQQISRNNASSNLKVSPILHLNINGI